MDVRLAVSYVALSSNLIQTNLIERIKCDGSARFIRHGQTDTTSVARFVSYDVLSSCRIKCISYVKDLKSVSLFLTSWFLFLGNA
jgi:hypothetical protein